MSSSNLFNGKKPDIPGSGRSETLSEDTPNGKDSAVDNSIKMNNINFETPVINEPNSSQNPIGDKQYDEGLTVVTIEENDEIDENSGEKRNKEEILETVIVEEEITKKEENIEIVIVEGELTNKEENLKAVIVKGEMTKKEENSETVVEVLTEKQIEPIIAGRRKSFWVFSQPGNWGPPSPERGGWGPQYGPPSYTDEPLEYEPGRNEFVQHVFTLVFIMLAITASIVTLVYVTQPAFFYSPLGLFLFIMCMITHMCVHYALLCSECSKLPPTCYILLVIGTLAMSMICSIICLRYAPFIILGAVLATTATVGLCLGLAYTSFDFTKFILIIVVASFALLFAAMTCGILSSVFGIRTTTARLVITCISAVVSSVVLVIEFQMILGGKNVEMTVDDYAFAAWLVYTSIIDIFLKLLMILGSAFGDE